MQIESNKKAVIQAELRHAMFAMLDPDLQQIFSRHYFTLEPLLMQLLRELQIANHRDAASPVIREALKCAFADARRQPVNEEA